MEKDFNRAGEKAWLLGFSYDPKDYIHGPQRDLQLCPGHRRSGSSNQEWASPNENEWDLTVDYRIEQGPLRGIWVRARYAYVNFDSGGGHSNNVRLIINYPLSLL